VKNVQQGRKLLARGRKACLQEAGMSKVELLLYFDVSCRVHYHHKSGVCPARVGL